MKKFPIPYDLKQRCLQAKQDGMTTHRIYTEIFHKEHPSMNFETFSRKIRMWKNKECADSLTLEKGTYGGFTAYDATVQVNGQGEVVQAWIKQEADDFDYDGFLESIKDIKPVFVEPSQESGETMLEIPLFDMHFGVATLKDYKQTLADLIAIICDKHYDEINVLFGQDMLHNNDFRGHTAKGTPIEKVDMKTAWVDAWQFWVNVLKCCVEHAPKVNVIYSKGNHDECTSWGLLKALEVAFPDINFDDSFNQRKVISWKKCFIGVTHGNETKKSLSDFRGQFTISFPNEFAKAKVREIHTGHLHTESGGDNYGVQIRRLSSAVPTDEWSDNEGFVGAIKRFMVFEWRPAALKAIYYI